MSLGRWYRRLRIWRKKSVGAMVREHEVVVIDDERDILEVVTDVLQEEGFAPVTFSDGQQALRHIGTLHPALILMDLHLPGMDGCDLARQLRSAVGHSVPIAVMTGASRARMALPPARMVAPAYRDGSKTLRPGRLMRDGQPLGHSSAPAVVRYR